MKNKVKIFGGAAQHLMLIQPIKVSFAALHEGEIVATYANREDAESADYADEAKPLERCTNEQLSEYCTRRGLFFTRG
jgi:hypothetical protein